MWSLTNGQKIDNDITIGEKNNGNIHKRHNDDV